MNFEFSEDQLQFRQEIRRFMVNEAPLSKTRAILESSEHLDRTVWQSMQAMGIQNIMSPEQCGGFGLGAYELCISAEEIGRQLAPIPSLGCLYLAQQLLLQCEPSNIRDDALSKIGEGSIGCLVVNLDDHASTDIQLADNMLTGTNELVHNANEADLFICHAKDSQGNQYITLSYRDTSMNTRALSLLDNSCSAGTVTLTQTPALILASGDDCNKILKRCLNHAAILMSFEQLGAADSALETATRYASERSAFGRIIGSYQGIKHKLVDAYTLNQLARVHCYYAAWAMASSPDDVSKAAATAIISSSKAMSFIAKENIQTHGGMGYTWEMDCHLYLKRSRHYAVALGPETHWQQQLSSCLLAHSAC